MCGKLGRRLKAPEKNVFSDNQQLSAFTDNNPLMGRRAPMGALTWTPRDLAGAGITRPGLGRSSSRASEAMDLGIFRLIESNGVRAAVLKRLNLLCRVHLSKPEV